MKQEPGTGGLRSFLANPWVWAFVAGLVVLPLIRPLLRHVPEPPPVIGQVPEFSLVNAEGEPFGSRDLAGRVYVANLFFTRCTTICPLLTRSIARLQEAYLRNHVEDIRLISISVDPEYDTPERLREYAETHGADPALWTFLTGPPDDVRRTVEQGFRLPAGEAEVVSGNLVDIAHSGKLVLVDRAGRIRGFYDSDEIGLDEVFHRSRHVLDDESDESGAAQGTGSRRLLE